jgi:Cu2+-containing amine oxidase
MAERQLQFEEDNTRRLTRALSWVRRFPGDNGYAHPIEASSRSST